ncbi:MAG: chorismate synthase, partial [Clostridia bacterium]|nr:chorismate synthase [Clostridia bacterium]
MANSYGKLFRITLFGESHSEAIGVVIDGVPSGVTLDRDEILFEMSRRAPGSNSFSTPRKESDTPEILSGVFGGKTTGTPIACIIRNTNTHSKDYTPELIRPSHADYSGMLRYNGHNDYRGGGHFSGRLTAPIVFAGAIAKQILRQENIEVLAHIKNIGDVFDDTIDMANPDIDVLKALKNKSLPFINAEMENKAAKKILEVRSDKDSIGGSIEAVICGIKGGVGSPFFESVESRISSMLFSVPAVKAVEFG